MYQCVALFQIIINILTYSILSSLMIIIKKLFYEIRKILYSQIVIL